MVKGEPIYARTFTTWLAWLTTHSRLHVCIQVGEHHRSNFLLQSNIPGRMGGGLHVGIGTDNIAFSNVVRVKLAVFFHNQAVGATGGGLSILHYRSDYSKLYYDFKNSLQVSRCVFANNTADYGQAIAMEALSIHERRFYNGI